MALALVAAVSCNKATPEKSEVEAGFKAKQPVPSVTINPEIESDGMKATVTFTVSGVTAETQDNLSVGVLSSTTPQFKETKFAALPKDEATGEYKNGTYTLDVPVSPNTTTYFRAVAANFGGTKYSDSIEKQIPDIAFHLKIEGQWYGEEASDKYTDTYQRDIIIVLNPSDPTQCIIGNLEPYYLGVGATYPSYNYVTGYVDDAKSVIVVSKYSDIHVGGLLVAAGNAPTLAQATAYADLVYRMDANGNLVRDNLQMTLTPTGGLDDCYVGGVTYRKR